MISRRPRCVISPVLRVATELRRLGRMRVAAAVCGLATLGFGGCAQSPQQIAAASHGKEYFPSSIYGPASRRVIADGQPIPRGGGQYLVGRPYTVAGQTYYPSERRVVQVGNASWYGDAFHGRLTANGEIYDRDSFTAAHPTMPLPSYARVTNLRNNYSMIVRVNDRGPYASNRIMDVSRRVAEALDFKRYGTARIKVEYVARASLAGSDDAKLLATLRTDGPAGWPGEPATMVAEAPAPARVASLAPYVPATRPVDEALPPRRRVAPVLVRESRPDELRPVSRPESVEAAYRRYGVVREARAPVADASYGHRDRRDLAERYDTSRERARLAMMPPPDPRRREEPYPVRLASRDAPHLPIRELLTSARYDDEPVRPGRQTGRSLAPPRRPLDFGASSGSQGGPRHRFVEARTTRYRDD